MQRKAVLLGEPGAAVAAAIVEGARLAFVYQATPTGQPYGAQQVCHALWDVMCPFYPDFRCCCIAAPDPFHFTCSCQALLVHMAMSWPVRPAMQSLA